MIVELDNSLFHTDFELYIKQIRELEEDNLHRPYYHTQIGGVDILREWIDYYKDNVLSGEKVPSKYEDDPCYWESFADSLFETYFISDEAKAVLL